MTSRSISGSLWRARGTLRALWRRGRSGVAGAAVLATALALPARAEPTYARVIANDMRACAPGKGPAVRVQISGLRSASGNLFVRTYYAKSGDWLRSKRYIHRIDAKPRKGQMYVCVPLPGAGRYAIAVQHDENGNRKTDFSSDGAGMSNNPEIKTFLGIPRPPSVETTAFSAGEGVSGLAIRVRYLD